MRLLWLLTASLVSLVACTSAQKEPSATTLHGTAWQLHAIQSMDDAQGKTRIADPSRFTLRLNADGSAALQLDCNRGAATWESTPAGDGSGRLTFGPVAATRALCPPPPIGERVARDLGFVRSYLLKEGKLFMSLMADGGIYEWHPWRE
jgi:heat shock protein HslJ